ncbi:hypothetical protein ACFFRR_006673 [Megaselia abdita]
MLTEALLVIATLCAAAYLWMREKFKYFEKLGVEYPEPNLFGGNMKDVFTKKQHFFDSAESLYKFGKSSIIGIFEGTAPIYMVKSPEVARQIFIKNFNHFVNHRRFFDDGGLFDHSLIQMENDKWKDMRSTLSPAFTGNKMRGMFELIREIAQQAAQYLKENDLGKDVKLKDFFSRFANDVIATTAFGFKMNSLQDRNNEFFKVGQVVTVFENSTMDIIKFMMLSMFNKLARLLRITVISKEHTEYFRKLVLGAMKHRSEKKIFRPDMINMLMEVRGIGVQGNEELKSHFNWTDDEIVAQCFIFFLAGFETVSNTLCFMCHELMENPEVQERLKQEVNDLHESLENKPLTYEALNDMKYAEAVILETLRKWPQLPFLDRKCSKAIDLEDPETGNIIKLKEGDLIQISALGIQRDPKYFPEPMKFDPERFSDENKKNISPNTFFPFGIGPRMCIGNRFAMLEIKALLFYMMKDVSFKRSEKSTIPMVLDPGTGQLEPKGGIYVKVVGDDL